MQAATGTERLSNLPKVTQLAETIRDNLDFKVYALKNYTILNLFDIRTPFLQLLTILKSFCVYELHLLLLII